MLSLPSLCLLMLACCSLVNALPDPHLVHRSFGSSALFTDLDPLPRSRRSLPAPHADTCLVCEALGNSPRDVVCGHAVEDLEGFTQQHCDELTSNADACPDHCPSQPTGLVGSQKCTWGPGFWCSKRINAHSCGGIETVKFCEKNKQGFAAAISRSRRSLPAPHADTCLVCKALDNSPEDVVCGHAVEDLEGFTMQHCNELTSNPDACPNHCPSRPNGLPGSQKCTWGPGFWCSKRINAHSCGGTETVKFCEESKQGFAAAISRSRRSGLVGSQKCTWGPAFWCSTRINAHSCGGTETVKFCEKTEQGFAAAKRQE